METFRGEPIDVELPSSVSGQHVVNFSLWVDMSKRYRGREGTTSIRTEMTLPVHLRYPDPACERRGEDCEGYAWVEVSRHEANMSHGLTNGDMLLCLMWLWLTGMLCYSRLLQYTRTDTHTEQCCSRAGRELHPSRSEATSHVDSTIIFACVPSMCRLGSGAPAIGQHPMWERRGHGDFFSRASVHATSWGCATRAPRNYVA